jgi:hypothetical protein
VLANGEKTSGRARNVPDVSLDGRTNLFVAEHHMAHVQKTAGIFVLFIVLV